MIHLQIWNGFWRLLLPALIYLVIAGCNAGDLPIYFENKRQDVVSIDVLEPAEIILPFSADTLALVYTPDDATRHLILYENPEPDPDDTLTQELLPDFKNAIYDGIFQQINQFSLIPMIETTDTIGHEQIKDPAMMQNLFNKWGADGLLAIDKIDAAFRYSFISLDNEHEIQSALLSAIALQVTVAFPVEEKYTVVLDTFADYFVMEDYPYNFKSIRVKEATGYLGYEMGKNIIKKMLPHWVTVQRKYYRRAHRTLREAGIQIDQGNWEEAANLWEQARDNENQVLAKHARFNLILYHEVRNELDTALEMALRYKKKYNDKAIDTYLKTLMSRLEDRKKLDIQLGVKR